MKSIEFVKLIWFVKNVRAVVNLDNFSVLRHKFVCIIGFIALFNAIRADLRGREFGYN